MYVETLEETALLKYPKIRTYLGNEEWCDDGNGNLLKREGFIGGTKEMQKQMYSEEEVLGLLHKRMIYTLGNDYQEITTTKWFQKFKKK